MERIARRMSGLGTETAFEILARAKKLEAQGREIVHLEIGEPDFDTPKNVVEAGVKALREGWTHYGPSAGQPLLREAIAEHFSEDRGVSVEPDNVVVTPGAKPILFYSVLACVNPGEEVIYPDPGFPIYESVISFFGAKPVPLLLQEERDFTFDIADLEARITDKTRMVIINSPHNPCGSMLTREDLRQIAELAERHDFWVLADEIYSKVVYEEPFESITQFPGMLDRTIVVDGYSKTYAMTGWRLGYGVMPKDLAPHVARLMTNSNSCTASFTQIAGVEALRGPQDDVGVMVREFRKRRDFIVDGLNAIEGFACRKPKGAFYVFPNVRELGMTSDQLQDRLLDEGGVATLAGTSFGPGGEGYLRFSYANSLENIEKALGMIESLLQMSPVIVTKDYLTLSEALGIQKGSVVALVGGGGKTSTLLRLCREHAREGQRVLATTTARMKMEELVDLGDVLLWDEMDTTGQTWTSWRRPGTQGTGTWVDEVLTGTFDASEVPVTFLGRSVMRNKVIGLPSDYLGELLSRLTWDVVVVEADGSRGRSIKGHRLGEPVVPLCASHCVIVIGADGIETHVNNEHCHRPEVIQDLLGVAWGERLSAHRLVDLLCHPRGLLSKIPGDIDLLVYVNKAPLGGEHEAANRFARELLERCGSRIHRVAVGDNRQGGLVEVFVEESGAS